MNQFNDYIQSLETYVMFEIARKTTELAPTLEAKGRKPILLSMGAPVDMVPQFVIDEMKKVLDDPKIHTYSTPKGEPYFLDAVIKRMKTRFNVELKRDEVCSLIGSKEGIANIIRGLANSTTVEDEQDVIMVPDPGYASYKEMIKVAGAKAVGICLNPENNFMPDMEEVLATVKNPKKVKAIILNYPNNPTGATCTVEYYQHCVDFCKKHDILLINDNAYSEIYFRPEDKPVSILELPGAMDVAVEFHSFSKPYAMTGWRLGWVCGNKEAVGMLAKLKSVIDTGLFKALQKAGAALLNSKEGDEYIEAANIRIEKKLSRFAQGLRELGWDISLPKGTFYLWIKCPPRYPNAKAFCDELLNKSGVVTVPGDAFGECGKGYVRLSIVADEKNLDEVIERMKTDGHTFN